MALINDTWVKKHISGIALRSQNVESIFKIRRISRSWMYLFRTVHFDNIIKCIKHKPKQTWLNLFVALYDWLPVQGSAQWLAQRVGNDNDPLIDILAGINNYTQPKPSTIGGSEISMLRGENPYQNERDLVKSKLGMTVFSGSIDTRWGKMLEPVITMYVDSVFNTCIVETGSIPGLRNTYGFPIQSYSPDGLAVIDINLLKRVLMNENSLNIQTPEWKKLWDTCKDIGTVMTLFEFKCPRRRNPKDNVPDHYKSQPQIGQCVINIMDIGIFGDGLFRKCGLSEFGFNPNYDKWFHNTDRYLKVDLPIVCGFIGIYNIPSNSQDKSEHIGKPSTSRLTSHNNESDIAQLTVTQMKRYTRELYTLFRSDITVPGSDYYHLYDSYYVQRHPQLGQISSFISVLLKNIPNIEICLTDIQKLVWNVLKMIFKTQISDTNSELLYEIVKNSIHSLSLAARAYNLDDIDFGYDLGFTQSENLKFYRKNGQTEEEFEDIAEQTADIDSYMTDGNKFYYPEFFYHKQNDEEQFSSPNNLVDFTLSEPERAKKWLYQHLQEFSNFCKTHGYKPVGVMPWKLMLMKLIPVWKKPDYNKQNEATIRSTVSAISSIRSQADEASLENVAKDDLLQQRKFIYKPLVDKMFPRSAYPPRKYKKKKTNQRKLVYEPVFTNKPIFANEPVFANDPVTNLVQYFDDDDFDQV